MIKILKTPAFLQKIKGSFTWAQIYYHNKRKIANKCGQNNFYINKKEAYVIAKTNTCNQTLRIIINDKEICEKLKSPETKIKISKYVKSGLNKISYEIINEEIEEYEISDVSAFVVVKEAEDE